MKNLFKSKKFNSFLLTMIMFLSLFLFSACGDLDVDDDSSGEGTSSSKSIYKLIYRPYSTTIPDGSDKSYGEIVEQNILDLSSDILSRIVGEYGIGDISVKDGNSSKIVAPNTDGVDYEDLLGLGTTLSDIEKVAYAQDFSKITNIYYTSENNKVLVLSNYSISISDLLEYDDGVTSYIAKTSLQDLSTGSYFSENDELQTQTAYKYSESSDIAYVFIGETIGSNSINGVDNVKTFVSKFFKSNFGNIQKSLTGNIAIVDGSDTDLPFSAWNWALTDAEFASCSTAEDYKTKYVEKFQLNMAVEIVKTILTRYEGATLTTELNNLYSQASNIASGNSIKEKFISDCCDYIDHLGLTESEKTFLNKFLTEVVVGSVIAVSGTNYNENCANILVDTMSNYALNPLLEYMTFSGNIEIENINGYVQSIVIMSKESFEPESFFMSLELKNDSADLNVLPMIRYSDGSGNTIIATPFEVDKDDLKEGVISGDFLDIVDDDTLVLNSTTDTIESGESPVSCLEKGTSNLFVDTSSCENGRGIGWCFNDSSVIFIEIVLPMKDLFQQNYIKSIQFGI